MRTIPAALQTLIEGESYDIHSRVTVEHAAGIEVDLSTYLQGLSLDFPSPAAPIATLSVEFHRETADGPVKSLAPTLAASDFNQLNGAFSPLLQIGRTVIFEITLTELDEDRPADTTDWHEVFRGPITNVHWAGWHSHRVQITCNDLGSVLQVDKSEAEYTYTAGSSIENVVRDVLDNNGFSHVDIRFLKATNKVLSADYEPGLQKTIWFQLWSLITAFGWIMSYRYQGSNTLALTFFEPERTKTTPDLIINKWWDYDELSISEEDIRNVGYVRYFDSTGEAQLIGPNESQDSILKYGGTLGIRRPFWIALSAESTVRSQSEAQALLNAASSDISDPDIIASPKTNPLPFIEPGTDLYTFGEKGRLFDSDQNLAPFASKLVVTSKLAYSQTKVRGKPSAGISTWKSLGVLTSEASPVEIILPALENLREIARTGAQVTYSWKVVVAGIGGQSWVHSYLESQPILEDKWPSEDRPPDIISDDEEPVLVLDVPPSGDLRYVQIEARNAEGLVGDVERLLLFPPDVVSGIAFSEIEVNQTDGSVSIAGWATDQIESIAYAYDIEDQDAVSFPTIIQAKAQGTGADGGGLVTGFTGDFIITLPISTVDFGEAIKVIMIAYLNDDGTGLDGTDADYEGLPSILKGTRLKIFDSEQLADGVVVARALVESSRNMLNNLEWHPDDWDTVSWSSGTLTLANGTSYSISAGSIDLPDDNARYVYFNATMSTTQLQIVSVTNTIDDNFILLASIWRAASSNGFASIIPVRGRLSIGQQELTSAAVASLHIQANAITETKIADDSISTPKLQANSVTASEIATGSITATKLVDGAVSETKIEGGAITTDKIAANTITVDHLYADIGITAPYISVADLSSLASDLGAITAGTIRSRDNPDDFLIDLNASGSDPFLLVKDGSDIVVEILANGDATFAGKIASERFTADSADFEGQIIIYDRSGGTSLADRSVSLYGSGGYGLIALHGSDGSPVLLIRSSANGGRIDHIAPGYITIGDNVKIGDVSGSVGFFGQTPRSKPDVTGSGTTAINNLLESLDDLGLIDSEVGTGLPVPSAPGVTISPSAPADIDEGDSLGFSAVLVGGDYDTITLGWTITHGEEGGTITGSGTNITYTAPSVDADATFQLLVIVQVSGTGVNAQAGFASSSATVSIAVINTGTTVPPPPTAPTLSIPAVSNINENQIVTMIATSVGGVYDMVDYAWAITTGSGTLDPDPPTGLSLVYDPPNISSPLAVVLQLTATAMGLGITAAIGTVTSTATVGFTVIPVGVTPGPAEAPTVSLPNISSVDPGDDVVLHASTSGGIYDGSLSYAWTKTNGPGSISGSGSSITYHAPNSVSENESVSIRVRVTAQGTGTNAEDGTSDTSTDTETFNVVFTPDPIDPIMAPGVSIGNVSNVEEGGSTGVSATISGGNYDTITYHWDVHEGPGSIGGSSPNADYDAPANVNMDTDVTVRLTVRVAGTDMNAPDGDMDEASAQRSFLVLDSLPDPVAPSIVIGAISSVNESESIGVSSSISGGIYDSLAYAWSVVSGGGSISSFGSSASYIAPSVSSDQAVQIRVIVTASGSGITAEGPVDTDTDTESFDVLNQEAPSFASSGDSYDWGLGSQISVTIPAATGSAPISYSASGLPSGISFSGSLRRLQGTTPFTPESGTIVITASNNAGSDTYEVDYNIEG